MWRLTYLQAILCRKETELAKTTQNIIKTKPFCCSDIIREMHTENIVDVFS